MYCSCTGIFQIWLEMWPEPDMAGFPRKWPDSGFARAGSEILYNTSYISTVLSVFCFCSVRASVRVSWNVVDTTSWRVLDGVTDFHENYTNVAMWDRDSRGRPNFGFGFGFAAECGQMGTFGGHSVSAEISRTTFGALSVSPCCCW